MKIALYDIENRLEASFMEEAMELVKTTREYTLTEPETGFFHFMSRSPDYHVEITIGQDGMTLSKCQCALFKKSKICRHAVAALIMLRDQMLKQKRARSKTKRENPALEEVLLKMKAPALREVIRHYAASHVHFRADVMAQHLHLLKKPDYDALLSDITPIDKYGRIKLNRNNIKTVRNILAILLREAQQLLKDKALREVLQILDSVMAYLYRMIHRLPQYRDQFLIELKHACRLFEALCRHSMAPRLQEIAIRLALDISSRDGYVVPKGTAPLLVSAEPFILDEKSRKEAFNLTLKKWADEPASGLIWSCLAVRWMRLWMLAINRPVLTENLQKILPEIILEFGRQGEQEDVLFAIRRMERGKKESQLIKAALQVGLKAARQTGDLAYLEDLAFEVSLTYQDTDAWDHLAALNPGKAARVLETVSELHTPGSEPNADQFLLRGWSIIGDASNLMNRLRSIGDIEWLPNYDAALFPTHREELETVYAEWIHAIRETYGGTIARQKLSNIFGHLKSTGLHTAVTEKIKRMDKKPNESTSENPTIRGFVFDLDGVIVDTAIHHFASWKNVMAQLGVQIIEEDDLHTRGASRMESLEYLLNRYGIQLSQDEKEMWASRKNDLYLEAIQQITPADLLPGALQFLIDSKKAGLRIALGSASKNARGVLRKLQIEDRFDAILDGFDAVESKPHPEIFIKACQALELAPTSVVVFEDAAKGVQAAIGAGCKVVGIGNPESLKAADIIIAGLDVSTPAQIIEQLS